MSADAERGQSFAEHLAELRRRVRYSAIAVVITTLIAFVFHEPILRLLMEPAQGFAAIPNGKPIYTDLTEFISAAMKASLLVGIFAALPFALYQLVMFVSPGLNPAERRYLYALMPATLIVFIIGAAFGYRILFPPARQLPAHIRQRRRHPLHPHRKLRQPDAIAAAMDGRSL